MPSQFLVEGNSCLQVTIEMRKKVNNIYKTTLLRDKFLIMVIPYRKFQEQQLEVLDVLINFPLFPGFNGS